MSVYVDECYVEKIGVKVPSANGNTSFDETYSPRKPKPVKKGCGHKKKVEKESVYIDCDEECTYCGECIYCDEIESVDIAKFDNERHWVFGWANISINQDGDVPLDWQGDITAPHILEKAAYNFVLKFRGTGENHTGGIAGQLIESVMFTKEKMQVMGIPVGTLPEGWWVGFYVPDEDICDKIKSGKYKMFSIQGKAKRLKVSY